MSTPIKKELPAQHSEWPIADLIEFCKSLDEQRFQKYYHGLKTRSPWLNPAGLGGVGADTGVFDAQGLRHLHGQYTNTATKQDDWGRGVPQGLVPNCEFRLRGLFREHERLARLGGSHALPGGRQLGDIVDAAVQYRVLAEEVRKMQKLLDEHDRKEQAKAEEHKARQLYRGGCRRRDGAIIEVDEMEVVDGIVTEMNMTIIEYMEECRVRRERKRAARNAKVVADQSA